MRPSIIASAGLLYFAASASAFHISGVLVPSPQTVRTSSPVLQQFSAAARAAARAANRDHAERAAAARATGPGAPAQASTAQPTPAQASTAQPTPPQHQYQRAPQQQQRPPSYSPREMELMQQRAPPHQQQPPPVQRAPPPPQQQPLPQQQQPPLPLQQQPPPLQQRAPPQQQPPPSRAQQAESFAEFLARRDGAAAPAPAAPAPATPPVPAPQARYPIDHSSGGYHQQRQPPPPQQPLPPPQLAPPQPPQRQQPSPAPAPAQGSVFANLVQGQRSAFNNVPIGVADPTSRTRASHGVLPDEVVQVLSEFVGSDFSRQMCGSGVETAPPIPCLRTVPHARARLVAPRDQGAPAQLRAPPRQLGTCGGLRPHQG